MSGAAILAGKSFVRPRRRGGGRSSPLPDFYIGAHAAVAGLVLLTRDATRYRSYFPGARDHRSVGSLRGTQPARALAAAAFERLGAARVEIRADPENARSRRVAEGAGFELEAILRRDIRHHRVLRDTAIYAHPLSAERLVDLLEGEHSHRAEGADPATPVTRWAVSSPPLAAAP